MSLPVFYLDRGTGQQRTTVDVSANSGLAFGSADFSIEVIASIDFSNTNLAGDFLGFSTSSSSPFHITGFSLALGANGMNSGLRTLNFTQGMGSADISTNFFLDDATYSNSFHKYKIARVSGVTTMYLDDVAIGTTTASYSPTSAWTIVLGNNAKMYVYSFTVVHSGTTILSVNSTAATGSLTSNVWYNKPGNLTQTFIPFTVTTVSGVIPCFGEGTQILTIENEQEKYVAVEKLVEGSVVKTYKHGARKIAKIVSGSFINDPQEPKRCMYKLPKTDAMTNDLMLTGGHAVLLDQAPKGLQFKIDDKYLSFAENNADFVKIDNHQIYKYYNFSMENDGDKDRRFGVWANGVLCETPSEKQLESFEL
jgi:Hint domain